MPSVSRQDDYYTFDASRAIVIDNGAHTCRVGWAGESEPRMTFRNVLHRPRLRPSGNVINIVGDYDPTLSRYLDFTRSSYRSAFDANVVYQFETMECVFDYVFNRMGVDGDEIEHPVLLTECPCNPLYSRSKMAELLFETYGIPSLGLGIDGVFSYLQNKRLGMCGADGLVVCSGFTTTHSIPIYHGEPVLEACCRTNVGGYHVTDYMKRLLSLEYPYHVASLSWEKVEALKIEHGYIAEDYSAELHLFQRGDKLAEEKVRIWQLPWVPPPSEEKPSEEELARKAAIREKQSQRLRDMAAAKRSYKIADLEAEIQRLEQLLDELDNVAEAHMDSILAGPGYLSRREVEAALTKATVSLKKAKGESIKVEKDPEKELDSEKYPLLDVPNDVLTPEQLKEKKKQIFLKSTAEGRVRAKLKRQEEEVIREQEQNLEEDKRLANPEQYLEDLRTRQAELAAKVEQRKRQKVSGSSSAPGGRSSLTAAVGGRSERLSAQQKERMKLLTTAAFDRGKDEDTFGLKDEDWQLYKKMGKDEDDDEADEDEVVLSRLNARLQELDPMFNPALGAKTGMSADAPQIRPLTAEDFRITLGLERFRCPEIIFQPHLIGIDQVGLDEAIGVSMRRLPSDWAEQISEGTVLLTGGNTLFQGIDKRVLAELKKNRPQGDRYLQKVTTRRKGKTGFGSIHLRTLFIDKLLLGFFDRLRVEGGSSRLLTLRDMG
ncbi:hypothetical protein GOP47_0018865 [Adiantum capillus-veneris]|uniref:Actin-related protein 5 n=1 Tax=Adiantum capillus-veneris TaxID=13818 RepID=A0A9D4UFF0_ADICA|nr:hypothetical protein GOP47_0018865 [Adiantum capillus-veneris]